VRRQLTCARIQIDDKHLNGIDFDHKVFLILFLVKFDCFEMMIY